MESTLTHWKKLTNPNYIGAYSLEPGQELNVTIVKVVREIVIGVDGKKEECTVAHLKNQKPFILNATNSKAITQALGTPYIERWAGGEITIYAAKVKAFGDVVEALRVRTVAPAKKLPELTPEHAKWAGAVKAMQDGNTTIEAIKKVFAISPKNEKLLCSSK